MITIDNILMLSICLFFPISLYQNYLTYIKTLELKEKSIILEFALYASLILMIRYNNSSSIIIETLYNIPLIISLNKKSYKTSLILSIIIILFSPKITSILIIKHITYFLIFINPTKEKSKYIHLLLLEFICLILEIKKISMLPQIFIVLIIYITLLYTAKKFINTGNSIIDLNKILEELNHEKLLRSSISKLTHELKNPIAVCNGYLEMLDINNKKKATKYISIITSEIARSKTIIDEFSNYGKLKKIDKEEMDLSYLFEDINLVLTPLFKANKASLTITTNEEIYIEGDYNKLKQVFINLLKNTIEAKKEDTLLEVSVNIKEKKTRVTIIVKDNGIGMSEETLKRVSEPFFTTKENGTGLGLAFSKEVIELHKGKFKISSIENEGTTITITLPKEKKSEDFNNRNY